MTVKTPVAELDKTRPLTKGRRMRLAFPTMSSNAPLDAAWFRPIDLGTSRHT